MKLENASQKHQKALRLQAKHDSAAIPHSGISVFGCAHIAIKHWFAQGLSSKSSPVRTAQNPTKTLWYLNDFEVGFPSFSGFYTKRYLFCFKTMVQMDIRQWSWKMPPKNIKKALRLQANHGKAFPRAAPPNPCANLWFIDAFAACHSYVSCGLVGFTWNLTISALKR